MVTIAECLLPSLGRFGLWRLSLPLAMYNRVVKDGRQANGRSNCMIRTVLVMELTADSAHVGLNAGPHGLFAG